METTRTMTGTMTGDYRTRDGLTQIETKGTGITLPTADPARRVELYVAPFPNSTEGGMVFGRWPGADHLNALGGIDAHGVPFSGSWPDYDGDSEPSAEESAAFMAAVALL